MLDHILPPLALLPLQVQERLIQRSYFVKADEVQLSTHIDSLWADAEDALFLQPPLGVNDSCCQGSW